MNLKIIASILFFFNVILIIITYNTRSRNAEQEIKLRRMQSYTELVFETETHFKGFELPDSLMNKFMLLIPEYVCNECLDSALTVLKQFQDLNSEFNFFIATAYDKERLNSFIRYKKLNCNVSGNLQS